MYAFLLILLLIDSLALVMVILLQAGKGGGLAASFGGPGGTEAFFGSRGVATFLSKATAVLGGVFMLLCFGLSYLSSHTGATPSLLQQEIEGAPQPLTADQGTTENPIPLSAQPATAPQDTAKQ